jgi:predicted dehydrogenase
MGGIMKFLVVGLGSMGKRRVRCLKALGHSDIIGYDFNLGRREETEKLYGIRTVDSLDKAYLSSMDAFIISVPPDMHIDYLKLAVDNNKPAFVEASVVIDGLEELNKAALAKNVLIAPSCTLRFHPAIMDIKRIVRSGAYGKFTNFSYHSGQYLPDWHPWEKVTDYYVSQKDTGGGREIVPFELTWIVDVLGFPEKVTGFFGKTMNVGADIDDTYVISIRFKQGLGTLLVDVASRYAVRSLVLNMERAQIVWRWDEATVNLYEADTQRWIAFKQKEASAHAGYNKNIIEDMYIE